MHRTLTRRRILGAAAGLLGHGYAMAGARTPADALLERAISAAGGERALRSARVLTWTGEASILAGDRRIELGVETIVEPFSYARSDTWELAKGRASMRSLEIDGDRGRLIKNGVASPMPAAMHRHEREQYALYGLMRLVPLQDTGVRVELLPDAPGSSGLRIHHPQAPQTDFWFSADMRLARAHNIVAAPDGDDEIAQDIVFDGTIEGAGVRWPRQIRVSENGVPYFELRLSTFRPRLARKGSLL